MANQYWLKRDDKMYGPYSGGRLKKLAGEGKIQRGDQISADRKSWQLAGTVPGLFSLTAPQIASPGSAPPSPEMSPRLGTASGTHHQLMPSPGQERQLQPRSSRTVWVVIGVIGVAAVVLAVAIAVWPWTPSGESIAFNEDELAQSDENVQSDVPSPRKPSSTRTPPASPKPRSVTKPPGSHKKPLPVTKRPLEKKEVKKKPAVTVKQFKAVATDFRAYAEKARWARDTTMPYPLASVLMYGHGDRHRQAKARGPASLRDLFEQAKTGRDALRHRCFYVDVSSENHHPVFVKNWNSGRAEITVTVPFEARGGGDGLSVLDFRQCDDPREDTYNSSTFGVLLKNGKLRTTSQLNGRVIGGQLINWPIYGSEATDLAERGYVIYAPKRPWTYVRLWDKDISAEKADRYGIRKNGGGLSARVYFTELSYEGPMGLPEKLVRNVKYFHMDLARRFGSRHLEDTVGWRKTDQPRVFVTTMKDPVDYVSAKIVAIDVRESSGSVLASVDVGTTACNDLTPADLAKSNDDVLTRHKPVSENSKPKGRQTSTDLTLHLGGGVTMKLVLIPAGKFLMGSKLSPEEVVNRFGSKVDAFRDEHPRHQVTISKPFYMGVTEVTRGQFAAFVADSRYKTTAEKQGWAYAHEGKRFTRKVTGASWRKAGFQQTDSHPVVCISWNDAAAFCAWLKNKTGRRVSLPTEAQWEYACRAGTTSIFNFADRGEELYKYANYCEKSCMLDLRGKDRNRNDGYAFTSPVGSYKPNAWGLYDMHGNVWEWCADWYADSYTNTRTRDPRGATSGKYRVLRGGSWSNNLQNFRAAKRDRYHPVSCISHYGFRVVGASDSGMDAAKRVVEHIVQPIDTTSKNLRTKTRDAARRDALSLFDRGRWSEALEKLKTLRAKDRGDREIREKMQHCQYKLETVAFDDAVRAGKYAEAEAASERAREYHLDAWKTEISPKLTLLRGAKALKNARYSDVRKILDQLKKSCPEAVTMIRQSKYREYLARGNAARQGGDIKTALAMYKIAKNYAKDPAERSEIGALISTVTQALGNL